MSAFFLGSKMVPSSDAVAHGDLRDAANQSEQVRDVARPGVTQAWPSSPRWRMPSRRVRIMAMLVLALSAAAWGLTGIGVASAAVALPQHSAVVQAKYIPNCTCSWGDQH